MALPSLQHARRAGLVATSACLLAALFGMHASATSEPRMPGPASGSGRAAAARLNRACEGCHVEVAAEWRASLHRAAYTDASFVAAHTREPAAFCRECHAPEADPRRLPSPGLARLGVGCVTCHQPDSVVLAAPRSGRSEETAPHPVQRSPRFATVDACAQCHEFTFADGDELMQSTIREHRVSAYPERPCADCHMPAIGGRRSHTFAASRDPAMLRKALVVAASRSRGGVTLELRPGEIGHAFPTGDLFRRLRVTVEVLDERGSPLLREVRDLARHFDKNGRLIRDDRVGALGASVDLEVELGPVARGRSIRWQVAHERVAFFGPDGAEVDASTVVASGVLLDRP